MTAFRRPWLRPIAAIVRRIVHPPQALFELAAIGLLGLVYISQWALPPLALTEGLDPSRLTRVLFDPDIRQNGLEHERLAGVLLPAKIGLERYGHIPTWNPYITGGEPLINNPFSYLLNPFHSLPVLLLGGVQGTKLATIMALLLAGGNMWVLARVLGMGAAARVTAGALYMMSGGLIAKFAAGHFQLGLSLAWPPLVLAGIWWTMRSSDRRAPILFGAAFALLYFAGNIYYALHTLLSSGVIMLVHLLDYQEGRWLFRGDRLRRGMIGGLFAVGLAAPQLVPALALSDSRFIVHSQQMFTADGRLEGSYSFVQAAINFIVPWTAWGDYQLIAAADYAYIGPVVFLLIMLGLLARKPYASIRLAGVAFVLALAMMVWGSGQNLIVETLYQQFDLLREFRFIGRALSIAALWWIVLAAVAVETLWKATREWIRAAHFNDRKRWQRVVLAAALIWAYWLVYSAQPLSSRMGLAFNNFSLLALLDSRRFSSFQDVLSGLWALLLAAVVIDTLWLAAGSLVASIRQSAARSGSRQLLAVRLARLGIFALVAAALYDAAQVNGRVLSFDEPLADFTPFYQYMHEHDPDTPFPAVIEPFSPAAFSAYEAEVNNWALNEGWKPGAPPGIIPITAGGLQDIPRWGITFNLYGDRPRELANTFVAENGYAQRLCLVGYTLEPAERCTVAEGLPAAALYEKPDVLPYAFLASVEQLTTQPGQLGRDDVRAVAVVEHRQDTITIRADAPEQHYLIVRENHFPGWQASIDGVPVQTVTAETDHLQGLGFIAVPAQSGEYTYVLRYEPPGWAAGVLTFLITTAIGAFFLLARRQDQASSGTGEAISERSVS